MKKQIILGGFLALVTISISQTVWNGSSTSSDAYRTGKVGIGTSAPASALHIESGVANDGVIIKQTTTGHATLKFYNNSTTPSYFGFCATGAGSAEGPGHFVLYDYINNKYNLFFSGVGATAGFMGVGTTAPAAKLDILSTTNQLRLSYSSSIFSDLQTTSSGNLYINPTGGKVGIGTTSPQFKLDVNGTLRSTEFHMVNGSNSPVIDMAEIASAQANIASSGTRQLLFNYYTGNDVLLCTGSAGKVYVGGFLSARTHVEIGDPTGGIVSAPTNVALDMHVNDGKAIRVKTWNNALPVFELFNTSAAYNNVNVFTIKGSGAVQIGKGLNSTSPHYNTTMLSVDGKVVCNSLYVRPVTDWADYVFADNYKLPNLYDIEKYYQANKHLPEIPSAAEVKENGINVGEMNTLLLKKIEEMTILMVKQQREIDELKTKIK
ncbi:MAG: hypothetical protein H0U95_14650 [Bacteroidetes bacterium]|nr:hypothetical protein [Bacteroidota bacterium]